MESDGASFCYTTQHRFYARDQVVVPGCLTKQVSLSFSPPSLSHTLACSPAMRSSPVAPCSILGIYAQAVPALTANNPHHDRGIERSFPRTRFSYSRTMFNLAQVSPPPAFLYHSSLLPHSSRETLNVRRVISASSSHRFSEQLYFVICHTLNDI